MRTASSIAPSGRREPKARVVLWVRRVLYAGVAASMLGIMGVTVVNVFMRYVLVSPISGSDEIVQFLLATLIFSAFPLATLERRHFSVALVRGAHGRLRFWSVALELLVSVAGCGIVTVQLLREAMQLRSEQMTTMVLELPLAPLNFAMSALAALALGGLIVLLIRHMLGRGNLQ